MTTPNLSLAELAVGQSGKEETVNRSLRALDALVQARVLDKDLTTPPSSPSDGDTYIVASGAGGAWSGQDQNITYYSNGAWYFSTPKNGWRVWVDDEDQFYQYDSNTDVVSWTSRGDDPTSNLAATDDPTSSNDETEGYSVGSLWRNVNSSESEFWMCIDATEGAAVWLNTTLQLTDLGSMAIQNAHNVNITGGVISGLTSLAAAAITVATLTVTGPFTSLGFDDNATQEVFQLSDTEVVLGLGDTANYGIRRLSDSGGLHLAGGASVDAGANLVMYGSSHATTGSDFKFRSSTTDIFTYDESASLFSIPIDNFVVGGTSYQAASAVSLGADGSGMFHKAVSGVTTHIDLRASTNVAGDTWGLVFTNSTWGEKAGIFGYNTSDGNATGGLSFRVNGGSGLTEVGSANYLGNWAFTGSVDASGIIRGLATDFQFQVFSGTGQPWYLRDQGINTLAIHLNGTGDLVSFSSTLNVFDKNTVIGGTTYQAASAVSLGADGTGTFYGTSSATVPVFYAGTSAGALGIGAFDSNYQWIQSFASLPLYLNPQGNAVVFSSETRIQAGNVLRLYRADNAAYADITNAGTGGLTINNVNGNPIWLQLSGSTKAGIDTAGTFLVGKTTSALGTAGVELYGSGAVWMTRASAQPLILNRLTSDGVVLDIAKSGGTIGQLGVNGNLFEIKSATGSLHINRSVDYATTVFRDTATTTNIVQSWVSDVGGAETTVAVLYADGDIENVNNSYGAISDLRLKDKVDYAGSQWNDIKTLRLRKYINSRAANDSQWQLGVIAQELIEDGMPGLVRYNDETDEYSVKYSVLSLKAIGALKENMERTEILEEKVARLEKENAELTSRVSELEQAA